MGIVVSIDGRILPPEEATVNVFDHGFLFGDSVYEVVRTRRGRPVTMEEHLARLEGSARRIYMELPWSRAAIAARVAEANAAGGNAESYFRIIVTRGVGEISLLPDTCRSPCLIVIVKPLPAPPASVARDGLRVLVTGRPRNDRRALDPSAKTGNYLNNLLALVEAHRGGCDDAILLNPAGLLAEATTSNLFLVRGGRVATPALECGILAGITRDLLLREFPARGIAAEEGSYGAEALESADEVFLTSTIRGVAPVTSVDGRPVGDGRPGPVTRRVAALYEEALDRL
ncbi:MAG: aminotransferase class IV, partial [Planctomycetaceae bacterium]|nr:aminotransferase class IV [Planctomycetaceae bacterium]